MGAKRRVGPAAVAAALIGIGLALYRPASVPELRPGPIGAPSPTSPAFASAIAWPYEPGSGTAGTGSDGETADADDASAELHDAPSDRGFLGAPNFPSASGAPTADGAGLHRAMRAAPSSAETVAAPALEPRIPAAADSATNAPWTPFQRSPAAPAGRPPGRTLLATGPAAADSGGRPPQEERTAVDPRRGPARPGASAWFRRPNGSFPLFRPPRRAGSAAARARSARRRKTKPLLLAKLLGRGALRPPPAALAPPDLSGLKNRRPPSLPGGAPTPTRPFDLDRLESQDPRRAERACRRRAPHWDGASVWHDGAARGLVSDARWLWLWKDSSRVWAAPETDSAPLLRHQGLWWSKQRGVWFALHEGELWNWRRFSDWDAEGLIRLTDGVELVYSADFSKVAVITPGSGAALYDAATGAELGDWLESELPRRRPIAPAGLRLPRGI